MQSKKVKLKIFILGYLFFSLVFYFPRLAQATSSILFLPDRSEVTIDELVMFEVKIETGEEIINAVSGTLELGPNLSLVSATEGGSVVNFWLNSPTIKNSQQLVFGGIIPGGFRGSGRLFSFTARVLYSSPISIRLFDQQFLRHDGQGSEAPVSLSVPVLAIKPSGVLSSDQAPQPILLDIDPPELFTPFISRDQSLFDNDWFIVFSTQDKQSGLDHYEIREGRKSNDWLRAESPYRLNDQSRRSKIVIRAIDRAGNIQTVALTPYSWYRTLIKGVILIVIFVFVLWCVKYFVRRLRSF